MNPGIDETKIVSDPGVMSGKPVVAGTRMTVELILEELAGGASVGDVVASYSTVDKSGIEAALAYALRILRSELVFPLSKR